MGRGETLARLIPLLVAFGVLLPGIGWGLPDAREARLTDTWGYDEIAPMGPLIEAAGRFRSAPRDDAYLPNPLFHYVLVATAYTPYLAWEYALGRFHPQTTYPYGMNDPVTMLRTLTLIGRGVTFVMALGSVLLVYRIVRLLGLEAFAASLTATATALLPTFVYYGRLAIIDVPYIFWTLLAMDAAVRMILHGRHDTRMFALFGVSSALAAATKDQAYAFVIAWTPLMLESMRRSYEGSWLLTLRHRPLWLGFALSFLTYALANNLLFGWEGFRRHVEQALQMSRDDRVWSADLNGQIGLIIDAAQKLAITTGPFFVLGSFGVARLARNRQWLRLGILVLPILSHHGLVLAKIGYCHARYMIFPAILFLMLAACAWQYRPKTGGFAAFLILLVGLGFAWLGFASLDVTRAQWLDARYDAEQFFSNHARPGERVETYTRYPRLTPRLPDGVQLEVIPPDQIDAARLRERAPEFILITDLNEEALLYRPEHRAFVEGLLSGQLGYSVVLDRRTPRVVARYLMRGLAPRVIVLERLDILP